MTEGEHPTPRPAIAGGGDGPVRYLLAGAATVMAVSIALFAVRHVVDLGLAGSVVSWAFAPVNTVLAAIGSVAAARAAGDDRVVRRFWYQLAVACLLCSAGVVGHVWPGRAEGHLVPAVVFALYLAAALVLLAALLSLPIPRRPRGGWVTMWLDLSIVVSAGCLVAWYLAGEGATSLEATTGSPMSLLVLLVVGVTGLMAVAKVGIAGSGTVHTGSIRILGATTLFCAFAGGVLAVEAQYTNVNGALLVLPLAGFGAVTAAERQLRAATGRLTWTRGVHRTFSLLPYAAVAVVNGMLLAFEALGERHTAELVIGSGVLTTMVIVRQLRAFQENARLLVRLDSSLLDVRRHERRFRSLLQRSTDIITVTDSAGVVQYASPGIESVLGVTPDEFVGVRIVDRTHPEDVATLRLQWKKMCEAPGTPLTWQARLARADGSWRWLEIVSTDLSDDPDVRGIVSNARDITDTRRYQDEIAYQATHDELTGLVNRTLFKRQVDAELIAGGGDPERTVVALVDLDDFKTINDRLGHTVGDALLREVAKLLAAGLRPQDTVARLGGDEFALLLRDVDPTERLSMGQRIVDGLAVPVSAAGHDLLVRASVGVAPGVPGADSGELLRRADVSMYAAKGLGRGRCSEFDPLMDVRAREHARLAADLSTAVDRGEVHLRYQPIVALPSGSLAGVEALVRWNHPVRGMVSPAEFIPVAERTGLIVPLGAWVLHESCRQAASWLRRWGAAAPDRISVNVSARQLIEPDFPATVEAALLTSGLPAERLTVEITETAVFGGGPALEAVQAMRALGVRVALDDFGTGHSSLGLLRTCPVDVLKVDKSFVDGVAQSLEQEAIVTSVSQIGTAMRLQVVAEGVETAQQADRLHVLGYRFAQGFHFARPLTNDEIEEKLSLTPVSA